MKGSHLAALVTGWLAVAVASAAIGSASVARVGLAVPEPRSQITVTRSAAPVKPFPSAAAGADFVDSNTASGSADESNLSVPPYPKASPRPTSLPVLLVTTPPTASAPTTDQPIIVAPPSSGSGGGPTLGLLPTPTPGPSSTTPGKGSTKKPYPGKPSPSTPVPSVLLASPASVGGP